MAILFKVRVYIPSLQVIQNSALSGTEITTDNKRPTDKTKQANKKTKTKTKEGSFVVFSFILRIMSWITDNILWLF